MLKNAWRAELENGRMSGRKGEAAKGTRARVCVGLIQYSVQQAQQDE